MDCLIRHTFSVGISAGNQWTISPGCMGVFWFVLADVVSSFLLLVCKLVYCCLRSQCKLVNLKRKNALFVERALVYF